MADGKDARMSTPLDAIVVADGNREAFERVIDVTQKHDEPVRLFMVGPRGAGKTSLLRARAAERDLLSGRKAVVHAAAEMINAIRMDAPDSFFEELGTVPVLLVDDFQDFFSDEEAGPLLCKLMLAERARLGLDTVLASDAPLSAFDLSAFEGTLDGFEEVRVEPLDEAGRRAFVLAMRNMFFEEGKSPELSDEAVEALAAFSDDLTDVRHAVQYLMTAAGFEAGRVLDAETVREALAS